jgi:two-component system KDP operon response regulator KdpE
MNRMLVRRVLVVEDDPRLRQPLTLTLTAHGYDAVAVATGEAALDSVAAQPPDVIILDLGLPDMDGTRVVEQLRGSFTMPVLVLSARSSHDEKVRLLDAGANDYITKPFSMAELLARVRVALRQAAPATASPVVATAAFTVDLSAKQVCGADGAVIRLTPTEWGLLELLARRPGTLVTQRELLRRLWGPGYEKETHYLRVYMGQLRRKLEPDPANPRHLLTEPGRGYRFQASGHVDPVPR